MKKAITIGMICVLLLNTACPLYFYFARRAELKNTMYAWLKIGNTNQYCSFMQFAANAAGDVTDPGFAWESSQKEFIYKGSLYDVVAVQLQNGQLHIKCVPDKAEDQLVAQMQQMMHKGKNDKSSPYQHLLKSFLALYVFKCQKQQVLFQSATADHKTQYTCFYPTGFAELNTPPPKIG